MKLNVQDSGSAGRNARGFTVSEVLIASALAMMVLAMVMGTFLYSGTSFAALGNYSDLDQQSRAAVDLLGREIRDSSGLVSFTTNAPLSLTFTNASAGKTVTITYDSTNRVLNFAKTGQTTRTLLTQCDQWSYSLFSKAPFLSATNITFYGATNSLGQLDATVCKLVNMTWKCSRTIFGSKRNTETIQTAEIVMRNKVN